MNTSDWFHTDDVILFNLVVGLIDILDILHADSFLPDFDIR